MSIKSPKSSPGVRYQKYSREDLLFTYVLFCFTVDYVMWLEKNVRFLMIVDHINNKACKLLTG